MCPDGVYIFFIIFIFIIFTYTENSVAALVKDGVIMAKLFPLLSFLFWCGESSCSKNTFLTRDTLFLHSIVGSKGKLHIDSQGESVKLVARVEFSPDSITNFEGAFDDPALSYLCKCGLLVRTALYNGGKFHNYLRGVRNAQDLSSFLSGRAADLVKKESGDFLLFLQDALLLLAVSEHVRILESKTQNAALAKMMALLGNYIQKHSAEIQQKGFFVNFADFVETSEPLAYSPQSSVLGRVNADRFLRLVEMHHRGSYDLSDVCAFLNSYHAPDELMPFLKMDNSLPIYLQSRLLQVPLLQHLTSLRHGFGYIYQLHDLDFIESDVLNILFSMEQVTFQLNQLFQASPRNPIVKESSMLVEFAKRLNAESKGYVSDWLFMWKHAFRQGLTEVLDYQIVANDPKIVRAKLLLLKIFFRDNLLKRKAVLELEDMFSAFARKVPKPQNKIES